MGFKDNLESAQRRVEAWWRGEASGRPVILVTAPRDGAQPYAGPDTDDLHHWFTDPHYVFPRLRYQLESTHYGGEAMPVVAPVPTGMVAILNKYLGAGNRYLSKSTTWSTPIIEDWAGRPPLRFDPQNPWWLLSRRLLEGWVDYARAEGLECFCAQPDLNGPTEILAGLRGAERLALDFYDSPAVIAPALREINQAWREVWAECRAITSRLGGYFTWMRIWSEIPAVDLQSDFSCLISAAMFDEYFLPAIEEQTRWADRTVYHLDGPDAVKHLDSLLALPNLDAIQWVQGAGAPPAAAWVPLYRRIQAGGKRVQALCEPHEVRPLIEALDPGGLMLVTTCRTEQEARDLVDAAEGWSR